MSGEYLNRANYLNKENCYLSQNCLLEAKHDVGSDRHFRHFFRYQELNFGKVVKCGTLYKHSYISNKA